nr:MAG TPA: hypothetical protein [Caudoviricetes sp.]
MGLTPPEKNGFNLFAANRVGPGQKRGRRACAAP